ncbi:MAG: DUF4127 family protein [Candidatus Calescibacterium sp.]|nr:DUF4127 family protein [Candidatus Calescibacterium sp.]MDW8133036.1 DUF4127 family protein [Candidatus Calescibacterium sp.]
MRKIKLLVLDDRPCSYKYFEYICNSVGINFSVFFNWKQVINDSNGGEYIISLDNLLFGGIVNSRNLEFLKRKQNKLIIDEFLDFVENNKESIFYVYVSLPRLLLNYTDRTEEVLAINIDLYKFFSDKICDLLESYENYSIFKNEIKHYILNVRKEKLKIIDYFLTQVNLRGLRNISEVLIVLDDSQFKGLNFLEMKYLQKKYSKVSYNFHMLVGLDEIHLVMLAKILGVKGDILFSSNHDLAYKSSIYEGMSLKNLLSQYEKYFNVDFFRVGDSDYYWKIFDGRYQRESFEQVKFFNDFQQFLNYFKDISCRNVLCFNNIPFDCLANVKHFVDISFANGASLEVLKYFLTNEDKLMGLDSFWAWNTLANSLGSSLAQYIVLQSFPIKNEYILRRLVVENFLESVYQTIVRYFAKIYSWSTKDIGEAFNKVLQTFDIKTFFITDINLPWHRYFEVDIKVELKGGRIL